MQLSVLFFIANSKYSGDETPFENTTFVGIRLESDPAAPAHVARITAEVMKPDASNRALTVTARFVV